MRPWLKLVPRQAVAPFQLKGPFMSTQMCWLRRHFAWSRAMVHAHWPWVRTYTNRPVTAFAHTVQFCWKLTGVMGMLTGDRSVLGV